jgi:hypothetical protein
MADNITAPATEEIFATDEIGGVHYPRTKVGFGLDGAYVDVSSGAPLPVTIGLTNAELRAAPVPVSGPLTDTELRAAAVPVSGPLTDAQLRAAAVPVSGPLTDAQLRATAVPITGSVTGPLTDAQLRAAAVPVSGPLTDAQIRATALPVSGPLTDAQLRASAVPVSASALPLPTGAATETSLAILVAATAIEDTASPGGERGMVILAQRRDSDTPTTSADGDYATLKMDEAGRLKTASQPAAYPLVTGTITASGQTAFIDCSRGSNIIAHMVATSLVGHNCTFEGSIDSTNGTDGAWFAIQAARTNANTPELTTGVLAATPAYGWELSVNGLKYIRVRATAHTSGTATWKFQQAPYATEPIPVAQVTATQPVSGTVTATGVVGPAAHDAAISGNPLRIAGRAMTANYAAVASGDVADFLATLVGAQVVKPYAIPEAAWNVSLALTTTTAQPLQAALAGNKRHITALQAINTGASAVDLIILDGAIERWRLPLPPNVVVPIPFPTELVTTVNTALNVNLSAAGTVRVNAQGYTAP